jgi:hypothetical protein
MSTTKTGWSLELDRRVYETAKPDTAKQNSSDLQKKGNVEMGSLVHAHARRFGIHVLHRLMLAGIIGVLNALHVMPYWFHYI